MACVVSSVKPMMVNIQDIPMHAVKKAAAILEEQEIEYSLDELMHQSQLDRGTLISILKKHWVRRDDLEIYYLNLTATDTAIIYDEC